MNFHDSFLSINISQPIIECLPAILKYMIIDI